MAALAGPNGLGKFEIRHGNFALVHHGRRRWRYWIPGDDPARPCSPAKFICGKRAAYL